MHQNCTALRGNISCGHNDATRRQQKPSRPTEDRQTEKERGRERKTGENTATARERERRKWKENKRYIQFWVGSRLDAEADAAYWGTHFVAIPLFCSLYPSRSLSICLSLPLYSSSICLDWAVIIIMFIMSLMILVFSFYPHRDFCPRAHNCPLTRCTNTLRPLSPSPLLVQLFRFSISLN